MNASERERAVAASVSVAAALNLAVEDAVVLSDSNRIVLRLLPCDVLARVAPAARPSGAALELEVARQLGGLKSPVAGLEQRVDPRVYEHDGFAVTLWTYHATAPSPKVTPREYAEALERLHTGMRQTDVAAPHFTDRVAEAQQLIGNPALTPGLADADRDLLSGALRHLRRRILDRGASEQLLHGEPHGGNVLRTKQGLLFTDLQTCCRGPVEFDIAHCAGHGSAPWYLDSDLPELIAEHYPGADQELVQMCQMLKLAMVAAWRYDRDDQFPGGRRMGTELIEQLRAAPGQRTG
ncbi:MAG: aminoglycoside phosphotransferase family protein [Dehalococcoidia bacterium]